MPAKPVFTAEQYDILHVAALRVWKTKFQAQGKKQADMAHALGITQQSVSNLLKGSYHPGLKVALDLAILDGKELEDLVGPYDEPSPAGESTETGLVELDACIRFYARTTKWSPWTVAAARAGYFGPNDFDAPEWKEKLDKLEAVLERGRKATK